MCGMRVRARAVRIQSRRSILSFTVASPAPLWKAAAGRLRRVMRNWRYREVTDALMEWRTKLQRAKQKQTENELNMLRMSNKRSPGARRR